MSTVELTPRHAGRRPVMRQRWERLTYLHWPVDPSVVQRMLPPGLSVDTFEDDAWVGLVPFDMRGIAFPKGPGIPYFGSFPETNVRTYVRGPDGPGVWFHSLDAARGLPVAIARIAYGLPYRWSSMAIEENGDVISYTARRHLSKRERSTVTVRIGDHIGPASVDERDAFLTARWRLYSHHLGRLLSAPVWHPPWPLRQAEVTSLDDEFVRAAGYPEPSEAPLVLYSAGVPVGAGIARVAA